MHICHVRIFLIVIMVAACWTYPVSRPGAGTPIGKHPALGCWELTLDRADSLYWRWPGRLRLDSLSSGSGSGQLSLRIGVQPDSVGHHRLTGNWSPFRHTDSIQVLINQGLGGLDLRLRPRGDTLRGYAGRLSDMGHAGILGNVVGTRIDCSVLRS
jgi:hypothetical protein